MQVKAVTPELAEYPQIKRMYREAFPTGEPFDFLIRMTKRKAMQCYAFYDAGRVVGMVYLIVDQGDVYIFYLVMDAAVRGRGYGARVLSWLKQTYARQRLFLDLEAQDAHADNAEQRARRREFYVRNGFQSTDLFFEEEGIDYEVMGLTANVSAGAYQHIMDVLTQGTFKVNFIESV